MVGWEFSKQFLLKSLENLKEHRREQIQGILTRYPPPSHFWQSVNMRWLRGFIQGDGTFNISFIHRQKYSKRIQLQFQFGIIQHKKSIYTLLGAKYLFGCGQLGINTDGVCVYKIESKAVLQQSVIGEFQRNGFFGKKQFCFILLSQFLRSGIVGVNPRQIKNFLEIINTTLQSHNVYRKRSKAQLMQYIQDAVGKEYVQTIQNQYRRNKIIPWYSTVMCEQFVTGFTDAEGCFAILLQTRTNEWPLVQCRVEFKLCAEASEVEILKSINKFFFHDLGRIYACNDGMAQLRFGKLDTILSTVIPFFLFNPLLSSKYFDFTKFVSVAYMMDVKKHKTIGGMRKIIEYAFNSNTGKDGQLSKRIYPKSQYLQFLEVAQTREQWKYMKNRLPDLKRQIMVSRLKQE